MPPPRLVTLTVTNGGTCVAAGAVVVAGSGVGAGAGDAGGTGGAVSCTRVAVDAATVVRLLVAPGSTASRERSANPPPRVDFDGFFAPPPNISAMVGCCL